MPTFPETPDTPPLIARPRTPARGLPVGQIMQPEPIVAREYPVDVSVNTGTVNAGAAVPPSASILVPPPASAMVQIVDRIGDIVGVIVVGILAQHRIVDGTFACGIILAILGVQSGFRSLGRKVSASGTAAGLGILALAVVFLTASNFDRTV